MPTSHTKETIYNLALDAIAEHPISNVTDEGVYVRWLNRNYAHYVEVALRQQPWNFAVEMHALLPEPSKPAYRWRNQYGLPPSWLRVLPPTVDGSRESQRVPHEVKGNKLFLNSSGAAPVEIVMNMQEPGTWDPLFASLIAARLANGMALRFTGKAQYYEATRQAAIEAFDAAVEINTLEGSPQVIDEFDILRARNSFGHTPRGFNT